jgi:hypothetical protein
MSNLSFYQDLAPLRLPLASLFQQGLFSDVPADWQVIVSDVRNSTQAVSAGRYNEVNLVAAGSLITALNVAKKYKVEVPFFFGGDGSTLLVPDKLHKEVLSGLAAHNRNSSRNFGLPLHIGSLPVSEVLEKRHSIRLAKLKMDAVYCKAIALGDGIRYAEQIIKQDCYSADSLPQSSVLNLSGLECRWNRIAPPAEERANVCYLIEAVEAEKQSAVYADMFTTIDAVYGDMETRHPLCIEQLKPALAWQKLKQETLVKFGNWKPAYFIETFLKTFFGHFAFRYNWNIGGVKGKDYLAQLIAHADIFAVDGRVNTIICGTVEQHQQFLDYLAQEENKGTLIYGHHSSRESIMTCYIENRNAKHIHFVDGADGGYTEASKAFKSKLQQRQLAEKQAVQNDRR